MFVGGSALWMDGRIENENRAGDHDIVVLRVLDVVPYQEVSPLVFHASRLRQLGDL